MRHRVKKIKFRRGKDANKMLVKKLVLNYLERGKIVTSLKKAKALKSVIEKLVEKAKEQTEANKNYLMHYVTDKKMTKFLFETVGPTLKKTVGGYVKVIRLGKRDSDGSEMARLEWAYPIVIETSSKAEDKPVSKKPSDSEDKKVAKKT